MDKRLYEKYKVDSEKIGPLILDTIVEIYGEKHREKIEENMKKIYINSYFDSEDVEYLIDEKKIKKREELTISFLEKIGEEISDEQKELVRRGDISKLAEQYQNKIAFYFAGCGEYSTFIEEERLPIYSFKYQNDIFKNENIERKCLFLQKFGLTIYPENYDKVINDPENENIIKRAKGISSIAWKLREEFFESLEELKLESDYLKKCKKEDIYIRNECKKEYLEKVKEKLFTSKELIELCQNSMGAKNRNEWFEDLVRGNVFSLSYSGVLESFSSKAQQILEEGKEKEQIEYIKQNQEKLCTRLGGKTTKEIEKILSILKDEGIGEYILKCYEDILIKKLKDKERKKLSSYKHNKKDFKEFLKEQNHTGLVDQFDISMGKNCPGESSAKFARANRIAFSFEKNKKCRIDHIGFVRLPILNIPLGHRDLILIHEILHEVEASEYLNNEQNLITKSGFHISGKDIDKYTYINEACHQKNAIIVAKKLHEKGIYLLDKPQDVVYEGVSNYEEIFPFIDTFFEENMEEIIDGKMSATLDEFFYKVGKENFEGISNIVDKVGKRIENREDPYCNYLEEHQESEYYASKIRENIEKYQAQNDFTNSLQGQVIEELESKMSIESKDKVINNEQTI